MTVAVFGDIHGCIDEFLELLQIVRDEAGEDTLIVSVGDMIDRGPDSLAVLLWFLDNKDCSDFIIGNHEDKMIRKLKGNPVKLSVDAQKTYEEIQAHPRREFIIDGLLAAEDSVSLHLTGSRDTVPWAAKIVHGAYIPQTDGSPHRAKALYGVTTGRKDEHGYPVRLDWAAEHDPCDGVIIVHGHQPVREVYTKNSVWNIDTGVPFDGKLTSLLLPEMRTLEVKAHKSYASRHVW